MLKSDLLFALNTQEEWERRTEIAQNKHCMSIMGTLHKISTAWVLQNLSASHYFEQISSYIRGAYFYLDNSITFKDFISYQIDDVLDILYL